VHRKPRTPIAPNIGFVTLVAVGTECDIERHGGWPGE
jgi:hypothetical protein